MGFKHFIGVALMVCFRDFFHVWTTDLLHACHNKPERLVKAVEGLINARAIRRILICKLTHHTLCMVDLEQTIKSQTVC
jgi:hypothetical protein